LLPFGVLQNFLVTTMAVRATFYTCHLLSPANPSGVGERHLLPDNLLLTPGSCN
jgi:hypothetical protein